MTMAQLGDSLRKARERRGLSVDQLSQQTTIPVGHIEALEAGAFDALPQAMYRRAEARAYAEAVGLDPDVVLTQLRTAAEGANDVPIAAVAPAHPPATNDRARVGRAVILLLIGCGALMWNRESGNSPSQPLTTAMGDNVPIVNPASLVEEAVRLAEPPMPPPSLRRVLYEPRIAAKGQQWPRNGRLDEGVLVVHSAPRGARVTVNGVGWGETPVAIRYLPMGELRVRVAKSDYAVQERIVRLTPDQPGTTLRLTLRELPRRRAAPAATATSALVITSVPNGARVTVNGIGWGTTPISIPHLPPGIQRVRIVKDHFRSEERVVRVGEGHSSRLTLTLKPLS